MSISKATISASIAELSEFLIQDEGVTLTDSDALARVGTKAETMIVNQLVREGMGMVEAQQLVDEASVQTARETETSKDFTKTAFANRDMPASPPAAANDAPDSEATGPTVAAGPATPANPAASAIAGAEADPASTSAATPAAQQPAPVRAMPRGPAPVAGQERAARLAERIPYTVEWKAITDVFRGIPANEIDFNFKVPVYNWSQPHPGIPAIDPGYNMDPETLATVLYAVAKKKSTALVGPHGCGKTKLVEQVGARLNMPVTILPMDGSMSRAQLFGQEKIRSTEYGTESYYQYGVLPMALEEPGIIIFDEFDRADEALQYACHSVYEQTFLKLLEHDGRKIPVHAHNRIFGTSNTKGRGSEDGMYGMAGEMSEATRDRWSLWIDVDYQDIEDDLKVLKAKIRGVDADSLKVIARLAHQIREAYKNQSLSQTCSLRQQLEAADYLAHLIEVRGAASDDEKTDAIHLAIKSVIIGRANDQDGPSIQNMLETIRPAA